MDKVTWFELPADDANRARKFYESAFGWQLSDMGGGSFMAITAPSDEQGAPMDAGAINGDISPRGNALKQPTIVITVEDLDEKIKIVESEGGKVVTPRQEMPEMNAVYATVADTEGNVVGLWQDLKK
jgi:uncharacterized protein